MKSLLCFCITLCTTLAYSNPILVGEWQGFLVQNYEQVDAAIFLPCTISISSSTETQIAGSLLISYTHSNGKTYTSKSNIKGTIDQKSYSVNFICEDFIYQDILPEKLKWCLGMFKGGIFRSKTAKQFLFKGLYQTKCDAKASLLIVYKK